MNNNSTNTPSRSRLDDVSKNKIKEIIAYSARVVTLMFASGTMMQTFLASLGFATNLIYLHSTFLQSANFLSILLFSRWAEYGSPMKRSAFTAIPMGLLFIFYIPIAISQNASTITYILLAAIGILQQVSVGLHTICQYKTPYYIYLPDEYGRMISICGIVSSVLSLGIGALISSLTLKFKFSYIASVAFGISAFLMLIVFISTFMQKSLIHIEKADKTKSIKKITLVELLKRPLFSYLIPANLLRGFTAGVIGVLATVALDIGFTQTLTTTMVSVQCMASLTASTYYAISSKKLSPSLHLFFGSFAILCLPLLLIENTVVFLLAYAVVTLGRTLVDYAVPSMLLKSVPLEIAGPYHAWRMAIQNAGTLVATFIASYLPIPLLLSLAAVFQMMSCIMYLAVNKKSPENGHKK